MARARNIKPAFFDNEYLAELPPLNRLLFIGLWCLADREGRIEYRPKRIKAQLFAYDNCDMVEMISSLSGQGFIQLYSVNGSDYMQINKWNKHQNPHHKEVASLLPAPKGHEDTVCDGYIPMSNTIRNKTYSIHGRVCCCCGATNNLEIDHKMPISKGGNSIDSNLQVLCKRCNVKKFDNYIDFSKLPKDKLSMVQSWFMDDSSITQEQFNQIASTLTDSLNLIPDSLNLIPDSLTELDKSNECLTRIFNHWVVSMNKKSTAKFTDNRKKCIKARLKDGYSEEDIITAITSCAKSPYHMGQNDTGAIYDDLTLICRNGEKLEGFINNADRSPIKQQTKQQSISDNNREAMKAFLSQGEQHGN